METIKLIMAFLFVILLLWEAYKWAFKPSLLSRDPWNRAFYAIFLFLYALETIVKHTQ